MISLGINPLAVELYFVGASSMDDFNHTTLNANVQDDLSLCWERRSC